MSAQLMALVRELKALNARKKAGETLTAAEEARRKELKAFLKSQLEGGASEEGAAAPAAPPPSPRSPSPPSPAPRAEATPEPQKPAPRPATMAPPPPTPVPAAVSPASPAPPKFVPKKDAFAIAGAAAFIEAAMNSEAVAKVDPWANRKAQASAADLADAEARAEAALQATKKRERATTPEEVEAQLREIQGGYTPPEPDHLVLEQYYGDYFSEGMNVAGMQEAAALRPIDPREIELRRALDATQAPGTTTTTMTVPPGLAFLDDFAALYAKKVLPPPADDVADVDDPSLLIGKRKVTVHLMNGEKKQGTIRALRRGELSFRLEGPGSSEDIVLAQVKAVFVHLPPNAQPKGGSGKQLTVLFRDQRAVQGESDDYAPNVPVFTLIPPAGRGQFEKIVINAGAVASVS